MSVLDFGIILGCKIYVKEITSRSVAERDGHLQEGDMVYKINNVTLDGLSLKEAKKLLESSKDKADIVVKRDPYKAQNPASQTTTRPQRINDFSCRWLKALMKATNAIQLCC